MYITFKSEKLIILISFETFYIICCDYCSIDSSFNSVIQTSSNGVILSNGYCDYEAEMKQEKKKREKEKKTNRPPSTLGTISRIDLRVRSVARFVGYASIHNYCRIVKHLAFMTTHRSA